MARSRRVPTTLFDDPDFFTLHQNGLTALE